jgi:hypothetical protein
MARRSKNEAAQAAAQAESAQEVVTPQAEEVQVQAPKLDDTRERMLEGLREGRKKAAEKIANPEELPPGLPPEEASEEEEVKKAEIARRAAEKKHAEEAKKVQKAETPKEGAAEAATEEEPAVQEAPTTSKQKVDGVEYDVPLSEIEEAGSEKAWRLNKAAENRLAKASEQVAKASQAQAQFQQQMAAWMQQNAPKQPQVSDEEFLASRVDKLMFGTPAEKAAAMQEMAARMNPKIDQNALITQTTANIQRDMANAQYKRDFSDVLANPLMKKLSDQLEMEEIGKFVQNGQVNWSGLAQTDWKGFYDKIGTQVRGLIGKPSQPTTDPVVSSGQPSPSQKEARKASIINLPTAAAARAEAPKEEKQESREESIARMKRSRGIPTG